MYLFWTLPILAVLFFLTVQTTETGNEKIKGNSLHHHVAHPPSISKESDSDKIVVVKPRKGHNIDLSKHPLLGMTYEQKKKFYDRETKTYENWDFGAMDIEDLLTYCENGVFGMCMVARERALNKHFSPENNQQPDYDLRHLDHYYSASIKLCLGGEAAACPSFDDLDNPERRQFHERLEEVASHVERFCQADFTEYCSDYASYVRKTTSDRQAVLSILRTACETNSKYCEEYAVATYDNSPNESQWAILRSCRGDGQCARLLMFADPENFEEVFSRSLQMCQKSQPECRRLTEFFNRSDLKNKNEYLLKICQHRDLDACLNGGKNLLLEGNSFKAQQYFSLLCQQNVDKISRSDKTNAFASQFCYRDLSFRAKNLDSVRGHFHSFREPACAPGEFCTMSGPVKLASYAD